MDGAIASSQKDKIITISPEVMAQKLADLLPKQVFNRACAKYSRLLNPKTSIPPAFKGLFTHKRYKIYYGGRGGAKSHSFARALVKMAAEKPLRILCTREFQSSIADSVHRLISDCIHESKLGDYFTITKTTISSNVGSVFIFKGLRRSINEIKSTEGVDICFIAGTLIGKVPIEEIQVGDIVESYNHDIDQIELRRVKGVTKTKRTQPLYKTLTQAGSNGIVSTGNHPVFVKGIGYIPITSLKKGDIVYEKVRVASLCDVFGWVWRSYRNKYNGKACKISEAWGTILHRLCEEIKFKKNENFQSNEQSGFKRQSKRIDESKRVQALCTRGKWKRLYKDAADTVQKLGARLVERISNYNREEKIRIQKPDKLQGGFSECLLQVSDRSGRECSSRLIKQRRGQQEGSVLKEYRVDSVEILKQQDIERLGCSDGGDYVYNLEVEVNSNYLANGILVHNCWIEEAQSISNSSWEILIPTIRKEGSEIWISFNPCEETDPTYQRFIKNTPPQAICQKVGYADNPYLPSTLEAERCYMLEVDPEAYAHVWGGECRTISDAVIFRGRFEVDDFDPPPPGTRLYYGVDWGFSQDPVALVRCWIAKDNLYVDQEAWGIGVELDHLPELFATVPGSRDWRIEADNSRPETVSHVKRRGFNIVSAPKWSGSIEDGLAVLKGFRKIIIHPRCRHAQEEFRLYSYKTDPLTSEILPIILDKHNHVIDALRYALSGIIKSNNFFDDIVMKDYPEEDNTTIFDDVKSRDRMATKDYPDE